MSDNRKIQGRIATVDGFRCIAVLCVLWYHYYYYFRPETGRLDILESGPLPIAKFGFYGVHFFFVISGFVILHTLEKCTSFKQFMVRRLIRLMPTLIFCALLTYCLIALFYSNSQAGSENSLRNFLPTLTFIPGEVWTKILGVEGLRWVDPSYWSLSVEMTFYLMSGMVFFTNPRAFLSRWIFISIFFLGIRLATSPKTHFIFPSGMHHGLDQIYDFYLGFQLSYWVYFTLGIFFYTLYAGRRPSVANVVSMAVLILSEFYFLKNVYLMIFFSGIIILFLLLIYRDSWLFFLRYRAVLWIGTISYPIYLLHQHIGMMVMDKLSDMTGITLPSYSLVIVTFLVILLLSDLVHRFVEKPSIVFFRDCVAVGRVTSIP